VKGEISMSVKKHLKKVLKQKDIVYKSGMMVVGDLTSVVSESMKVD